MKVFYVINLPSKKDYKQQRRYTCELKHKELLNWWFISVDICHLYLSEQILNFCDKNWEKNLFLFSCNSFYL